MAISMSDIIRQNAQGQSEGFPAGVPTCAIGIKAGTPTGGRRRRLILAPLRAGVRLSGSWSTCGFESKRDRRNCECKDLCPSLGNGPMGVGAGSGNGSNRWRPFRH
jgi:hypothetical protein